MDFMFILFGIYSIIIFFVIFALFCGPADYETAGISGQIHWFITREIPKSLGGLSRKILGEGCTKKFERLNHYCCYEINPFMQLIYLTLVLVGYGMFLKDGLPLIPNPYLSSIHSYTSHCAVALTLFSFVYVSRCDPGKITKKNAHQFKASFPYDGILYVPKECKTCGIERPARSKHCSFCNHCVSRFDHHCPWINNCVGENNVRFFITFLILSGLLCLYCAYLAFYCLMYIADKSGIFHYVVKDKVTGKTSPLPWTYILQYLILNGKTLFPLGAFCFIIALVLFCFAGYHIWLATRNTTTNETFKWSDYKNYVKHYIRESKNNNQEKEHSKQKKENSKQKENELPKPIYELDTKGNIKVNNIYNKGALNNLREVLFPPSYRKSSKKVK